MCVASCLLQDIPGGASGIVGKAGRQKCLAGRLEVVLLWIPPPLMLLIVSQYKESYWTTKSLLLLDSSSHSSGQCQTTLHDTHFSCTMISN